MIITDDVKTKGPVTATKNRSESRNFQTGLIGVGGGGGGHYFPVYVDTLPQTICQK